MIACDNCHDEVEYVAELGSHSDDEYGPCSYCAACLSQALARAQGRERTIGERLDILPTPFFTGVELQVSGLLRSQTPREFARRKAERGETPASHTLLVLAACLPSERSRRAFSVWCARQSEGSWTDPATRRAVEGAEESTKSELLALYSDAGRACKKLAVAEGSTREHVWAAMAGLYAAHPDARQGAFFAVTTCQADISQILDHLVEVLGP